MGEMVMARLLGKGDLEKQDALNLTHDVLRYRNSALALPEEG
jgi:hypothetical protein